MIKECYDINKKELFDYIGDDYGKCLYIYIDLKKYSLDNNDNFFSWIQVVDGEITCIITEYYGGIQLYSKALNLDANEIADFLKEKNPKNIFGVKPVINIIHPFFEQYIEEVGTVGRLESIKVEPSKDAYSVNEEELEDVCKLVSEDESIGAPYGYDSLYRQYLERMHDNFGRNYVLRDQETGLIICHAGTYAELPELAVIGGVITAPEYRGKGYSKPTLAAICSDLIKEGKKVFSFFYIPSATAMHYGVGFIKIEDWAKLFR